MPIALAGLDGEVIAIALLFALLAGVLILRPLLVAVLSNAPIIGGWLVGNVNNGLGAFERAMQAPAAAALGILSASIDWLQAQWAALFSTLGGFSQLALAAIWRLQNLVLPAAEQAVENWASHQVAQAEALAQSGIVEAEHLAAAGIAQAEALAQSGITEVESEALRLAAANDALARGLFAVAEQDVAALLESERAFVVNQVLGVEAEIQSAFARSLAISAAAEAALQGDIQSVEQQLGASIRAEVDSLLAQIKADKEALTAALTGSLAGVIADIAAIRALRCIQRCAELGALGEALQVITLAEILGLIEMILHQPADFRAAWLSGVQPLISSTVAGVRAELGV